MGALTGRAAFPRIGDQITREDFTPSILAELRSVPRDLCIQEAAAPFKRLLRIQVTTLGGEHGVLDFDSRPTVPYVKIRWAIMDHPGVRLP